jgi:uncharacterized membrane protein
MPMAARGCALAGALVAVLLAAYPLAVYWGLAHLSPRVIGMLLLAVLLLRWSLGGRTAWQRSALLLAGLLAVVAWAGDAALPLKLYPVAMNAALLGAFALSLWRPPTLIETIARRREPNLPAAGVAYTRRVTQAWCVFFLVNGSIALATALAASDEIWMLYNGLLAYGLIGAMFAGEWLVRRHVRQRWAAHV